jgi:hypothetical protein
MLFLLMVACSDDKRRIEKCVEAELNLHPEAHLVDLYKYFLQDVCGPGHLISNREEAEKYLDQELSAVKKFEPFDYQELMYKGQFVRVNLRMIINADISKQEFLNAFIQSAQEFKIPEVDEWRKEWTEIVKVIKEIKPDLPGFKHESFLIDSMLLSGNYAVHHSQDYIRAYDPHYRIIRREFFKTLVLKKSTAGGDSGEGDNRGIR